MTQVKIDQRSVTRALNKIAQMKKDVKNLKVPHKRISVFLDRWVQQNFDTEGDKVGGWEPFARGGRWIRGKGIDTKAKLLQDTGRLKKSFDPFFNNKDAGIGSDLRYAEMHHKGNRGTNLPARRLIPNKREVTRSVNKIYDDWIKETIRKKA